MSVRDEVKNEIEWERVCVYYASSESREFLGHAESEGERVVKRLAKWRWMCGKAEQYLYNKRQSENREREEREMVVVVMMMMMM